MYFVDRASLDMYRDNLEYDRRQSGARTFGQAPLHAPMPQFLVSGARNQSRTGDVQVGRAPLRVTVAMQIQVTR